MIPPTYFTVSYTINPWMGAHGMVARKRAVLEWNSLYTAISTWADVICMPPTTHPDIVFTANAGLVRRREVILSSFAFAERKAEEPYWQHMFSTLGYTIHTLPHSIFEGAGDALFAGNTLIGGYGFRTDRTAYDEIVQLWPDIAILPVELVDPRFYHLDTCLCVLDAETILYYPAAFSRKSQADLSSRFTTIAVPTPEALAFGCNAVVIGRRVILPEQTPKTQQLLRSAGYIPETVSMKEFMKSGGAAKCLTLAL